ncbi:MAG: hypothetical protein R3A48_28625 [Polyangiales bacterium]
MTRADLRALAQHDDPTLARLADEALHALDRIDVRRAALAGAPTHLRVVEGGRVHVLGPAPQPPTSPEAG